MSMKLSTGKVAFPIEFDNGAKETIYLLKLFLIMVNVNIFMLTRMLLDN